MEQKGFFIGAIVYLRVEYGVVVKPTDDWNEAGLIHWDTNRKNDLEDWRGLFGTFADIGGQIIETSHNLTFINIDGTLK